MLDFVTEIDQAGHTRASDFRNWLSPTPVGRFGQHQGQPPAQQRITNRLRCELQGERDEPGSLPSARARPGDRGVLLEQSQEEGAFRGEMPIDRALRKPRGEGDLIERGELKAALREQLETCSNKK